MHVLGAPPAFVLSQDQTLSFIPAPTGSKRSKLRPSRSAETNPPNHQDPPEDAQTAPPPPEHPLTTTTYHVKEQRLTATVPKRLPEACASRPPIVGVSTGTSAEPRIYAYSPAAASPFFYPLPTNGGGW